MKNYLIIIFILTFFSCTKSDIGPQGPAGIQGESGPVGAQGETGPIGPEGNANVQSITIQLNSNDWLPMNPTSGGGYYGYKSTVIVEEITQAIVDSGIVSVFYFATSATGVSDSWTPLPYNEIIQYNSYAFSNWTFFYKTNEITFRVERNNWQTNPGDTKFKVIIASASNKKTNQNINWLNYNEIIASYNLQD